MDELIAVLARDVKSCEQQLLLIGRNTINWYATDRMCYGFRVSLGRALLTSRGEDPSNVDKADQAAKEYMNAN